VSAALWIAAAYLMGGIPTSYLAGKRGRGIDLREHGSGSLGATNAYRVLGWKYAVPVGLFDVAKGAVPVVLLGRWPNGPAWLPVAVGTAAVAGHVFSPYVRFKGGKGVATAAGVFLALAPLAIAISIGIWCGVLWVSGYVSVASLAAVGSFPVWARLARPDAPYTFWASVVVALLIVVAHRSNIRRLVAGTESRFRTRRGGPPHDVHQ
jgi:acyl phosphate:glycerol-3-phosphate acyltransferase